MHPCPLHELLGQFISEDSRSSQCQNARILLRSVRVATDLFLAKRASRLFLSNLGKGIYSNPRKSRRSGRNSRFPAHSVYDNCCSGASVLMQEHLRLAADAFGTDQRNTNVYRGASLFADSRKFFCRYTVAYLRIWRFTTLLRRLICFLGRLQLQAQNQKIFSQC